MIREEILGAKEEVFTYTLENGLKIYLVPNNKVKNFYITLSTKYGSINTDFNYKGKDYSMPNGIAHYLEHLMFNMPDGTAHDFFAKIGANANAFTSYDVTCYEVFSNSYFKENLAYLLHYVYTPYFTKEMVNNERGIILEEIKMYEDNPNSEILYGIFRNLFINDKRKYLISGTIDDVKKIKLEDILVCYEAFYHPENMFLIITGNFNPEEAIAITTQVMNQKVFDKYEKPILKEIKEPFKILNEYTLKETNVDRSKVSIGYKIPKSNFKNFKLSDIEVKLYLNLFTRINFGSTSLLKEELQSNNIITEGISTNLTETDDYYVVLVLTSTDYPDYFIKRVREVMDNKSITYEDIERKVNVSISNLIMMFDDIEVVNNQIQDDVLAYNKYLTNIFSIYKKLNIDDYKKIINKFDKKLESISILKPIEKCDNDNK